MLFIAATPPALAMKRLKMSEEKDYFANHFHPWAEHFALQQNFTYL
jgi:hypothetical protein